MKAKNIVIIALVGISLTACKDKTYKSPTLDAMRSANKARAAWARETEEHPAIMEKQTNGVDSIEADSISANKNSFVENIKELQSSIEETEE